jgi:hypothetical protein
MFTEVSVKLATAIPSADHSARLEPEGKNTVSPSSEPMGGNGIRKGQV